MTSAEMLYQNAYKRQQQQQDQGPQNGAAGSYTGGTDAQGYGGAGEIAGGSAVNVNTINSPYFQQDRNRLGGLLAGQNPFASGDWQSVINNLKERASGMGPSLAGQQYQQAMANTTNSLSGMAHGGSSPGQFRAAAEQMGQAGQGMAAGVAQARTNEQMQAQGALTQALGSRDQLNQSAYMDILGQQLGLSAQQLKALQGNQQYNLGYQQNQNQLEAAQWQAVASVLGTAGKLAG